MHRKYTIIAGLISILLAILILFSPLQSVVTVTNRKTFEPVLYLCLNDSEEFIIEFTHSVNKRPVYDYIRRSQNSLLITKSRYDAFGAGMPESAPEGAVLQTVDGILELSNLNREVDDFTLFVGTVANHTLTARGTTLRLADIVPPGTPLTFKITRISFADLWKGRCIQ